MTIEDMFYGCEDFESQNTIEVKERLEKAIRSKAVELREKYGVEKFDDESFEDIDFTITKDDGFAGLIHNLMSSTTKNSEELKLFFHLVKKKNILDNDEIDLYVAKALVDYAERTESDFREIDREYGYDLREKLLEEAENLLSKPLKNSFERAYQCYLLGEIENSRASILLNKTPGPDRPKEVIERIDYHHKKAARFLEESLYHSKDIEDARSSLFHTYKSLQNCSSEDGREEFKAKLERFNAVYPEHDKAYNKVMQEIMIGVEETKASMELE